MKRFVSITLVLMLVFALAVSLCANAAEDNGSPTPDEYLYMTAKAVGDGEASVNPDKVILGSGDTVTFTATEKGGKFIKWELHCEYDIISGSLTDKVLVVEPKTDIEAIAYFEGATTPDKKDDGKTAPKTGYPVMIVFGVMGLALIAGVVATKRIKD